MRIGTGSLVSQDNAIMDRPNFGGGSAFGAPRLAVRPAFGNDRTKFDFDFGAGPRSEVGLDDLFAGGRPKGGRGGTNGYVPDEPRVDETFAAGRGRPKKGTQAKLDNQALFNALYADGRGGGHKGTGALAAAVIEIFEGTSLV